MAAAYGAAKAGARTILLEKLGFCGGTPVAAMIHTLDAIYSCEDTSQVVVGGYARDLVKEVTVMGGLATGDNPEEALSLHPEFMKIAADRLLERAGVRVLYHATVIDALMRDSALTGVEVALRDGRAQLRAGCVVDGTGDAEISHFAGVKWTLDEELQAITYHFRLGNVEPGSTWQDLEESCRVAMKEADARGNHLRYGGPWVIRLTDQEVSINATRVYGNPIDPEEFSSAEQRARESMLAIWRILRDGVAALRQSYILSGATELHVRESRKILGEYVLTEEDIRERRSFPDVIALGAWPIDIHPTNGYVGVHPHKDNPLPPYEIPYRCLVPLDVDQLLVAGRPISTTHRAHGSTRVPGTSMATGQAAGIAAAISVQDACSARRIGTLKLQKKLLSQGAILSRDQVVSR
ncbi:MAG TPA: FAD-dependent oxidoreductase [Bryobacteraceae bacterium]|nr:FAD-dependent oxidoreductase [Bryobacteraceae bacterium]